MMRRIPAPSVTASDVFNRCINSIRDSDFKERLLSVLGEIEAAANEYETKASTSELYLVELSSGINNTVTADEMKSVYTKQFVPKKAPGREIYEKLLAAPPHGLCPFCGQRVVSTLDHYLPKAHFSKLVLAPMNLIPLCFECNKIKTDSYPTCDRDQHPHPYIEDFDNSRWLAAEVKQGTPPSLSFYCDTTTNLSEVQFARIQRHFQVLKLGDLYASHAAAELVNLRGTLGQLHSSAGKDEVYQHLKATAYGHVAAQKNSWQSAMYTALRDSDWYCDGGFCF